MSISMTDGSVASIVYTASGDAAMGKERVEIFCDGNVAIIDDFKSGTFLSDGKKTKLGGSAQDKGHGAEIAAFVDAARGGTVSPIALESLVATTLASFAVVESIRSAASVTVDPSSVFS